MGTASGLGTAVEAYHETLAELEAYFIRCTIELLHDAAPCSTLWMVAALRDRLVYVQVFTYDYRWRHRQTLSLH